MLLLTVLVGVAAPRAFAGEIPFPGVTGNAESPGIAGPQESPGITGPQESPGFVDIVAAFIAALP